MKNSSQVLNELQSNYDELLHKFAAAENALDKVRRLLHEDFSWDIQNADTFFYILKGQLSY